MKKIVLVIAVVLAGAAIATAQSPYPTPTRARVLTPRPTPSPLATQRSLSPARQEPERPPRLKQASRPEVVDQLAVADDEYIYLRAGTGVVLPVADDAPLVLRLDAPLSTSGMKGVPMNRNVPLRSPVLTRYAQVIAQKDILVETSIIGNGAGFKNRAELAIMPQVMYVDINGYVQVGERDGHRVFLKPGKWMIKLYCHILAVENPDGRSWYAKSNQEGGMKGGRFGFQGRGPSMDDQFSGLLYLNPYGPVAYGFSQVKGLFMAVFKRPNIKLPERTEVHYRVSRMEATYVSGPMPKGPARIVEP